jgi:hypothetical protein
MSFIAVAESVHGFAIGHSQIALRPLQRLDMWLLVNAQHHGLFRRIQVQTDNVRRFGSELRICRNTPTPPPL